MNRSELTDDVVRRASLELAARAAMTVARLYMAEVTEEDNWVVTNFPSWVCAGYYEI